MTPTDKISNFTSAQGLKIDGVWNEVNKLCETRNAPTTETTSFKMTNLRGDTYYQIQIRAHNAMGFSNPVTLLMRTAVGESSNALGSLLYYGPSSAISYSLLASRTNLMLITLFSFCVRFYAR